MLMEWSDLMPGDVLKFTKEFRSKAKDKQWFQSIALYDYLTISTITGGNTFRITFIETGFSISITSDGKFWDWINYCDAPVFKIVKLAEQSDTHD